jgi:hypothetical protein
MPEAFPLNCANGGHLKVCALKHANTDKTKNTRSGNPAADSGPDYCGHVRSWGDAMRCYEADEGRRNRQSLSFVLCH